MGDAAEKIDLPELMTVDELVAVLKMNKKHVYAMVAHGEVPGVRRFGRRVRLVKSVVVQWILDGQGRRPRSRR